MLSDRSFAVSPVSVLDPCGEVCVGTPSTGAVVCGSPIAPTAPEGWLCVALGGLIASFVSDGSRDDFLGGGTNDCAVVDEPTG